MLRDKPQPARTGRSRPPISSGVTPSASRARSSTGWSSSATASRFPAPNLTRAPGAADRAAAVRARPARRRRTLFDQDLRPTGVVWHPAGKLIAFVADPTWRQEIKYDRPDIWTVTTDGRRDPAHRRRVRVRRSWISRRTASTCRTRRTFGTDMIIEQKLNHGGPRDLFVRPVGRRRADQPHGEVGSGARRLALVAGRQVPLFHRRRTAARAHLFRVASGRRAARGRAGDVGSAPARRLLVRPRVHDDGVHGGRHDAPADVYVARIDGSGERRLTDVHRARRRRSRSARPSGCKWKSLDGTPIEGWLTLSVRLRSRARALSADRVQSRRSARGDRLQLRFQEAVLRRQRLLRARHELPQLDGLRRRVQVGDLGRVGRQGRPGRDGGHRLRHQDVPDRSRSASATPAIRTAGS